MDGQLASGTILNSKNQIQYRVVSLLGAGGQGETYTVENGNKQFALKWYFKHMATDEQKKILENLIEKGAPHDSTPHDFFLWPQDMIFNGPGELGYIMQLRPSNYKSIVDMMKRREEPSFRALCRAAYNLTRGFQELHEMGYSYRDISFGNLFFDPNTGDILICDNDNVSANGMDDSSVYGTPRFMAPEIVRGEAKPSRNTDLYSLAVLLFYMFMMGHPLDGKLEAEIRCLDFNAMNKLYGTNPVFIYDPEDKSNRPVEGYQDNVITFWGLYPKQLKDLFTHAFTVGLTSPNKRVTDEQWLDCFTNLMSGIVRCRYCGAEVFYDEEKASRDVSHVCWHCGKSVEMPHSLVIEKKYRVLLTSDTKLYSRHITGDYDMDTVVGSIAKNPNNPKLWGIRNESNENWTYIRADGSQVPVQKKRSAAITPGAKIDFGQRTGEFT